MGNYSYDIKQGKFVSKKQGKRFFTMASNDSFVGWDTQDVSADASIYPQLVQMVSRSRDLERNNDYIVNYLPH